MTIRSFESTIPASAEELYAWHSRPGALERLRAPWQSLEIVEPAVLEEGSRARLKLRKGPFSFGWTAEHREIDPARGFTDVQVEGPFRRWIHRHDFEPAGPRSILRDTIDYALPGGALGPLLAGARVRRDLEATFAFRHATTARDLARHAAFADSPPLRVGVTGASGLVGSSLVPFLTTGGHSVQRLERPPTAAASSALWTPESGLAAPAAVDPLDAVVHLAGESIGGGRWTAARKERIRASRVEGTRNLVRALGRMSPPPKTLVCASAVGFYGSRGDELLTEESAPGAGFLTGVCHAWEEAAGEAAELGVRVVMLRFGPILSPAGGALAKMLPHFRLGAGGRLGDGSQFVSWISIDDAVGAIHRALLDERLAGPVNAVAPSAVTNRRLTAELGRVLRRPTPLPAPAAAVRLLFGEMADEMFLASTRVRPAALEAVGFDFHDVDLEPTLAHLLGRPEPT